jgi:hypothetical protein
MCANDGDEKPRLFRGFKFFRLALHIKLGRHVIMRPG